MEEIIIYKFQLEIILNALRLTSNLHNSNEGETCFDREVRDAHLYAKNALEGKKDIKVRDLVKMKQIKGEIIRLERINGEIHIYIKSRQIDKTKSNFEIHRRLKRKAIIYGVKQISIYSEQMNFDLCQTKGTKVIFNNING